MNFQNQDEILKLLQGRGPFIPPRGPRPQFGGVEPEPSSPLGALGGGLGANPPPAGPNPAFEKALSFPGGPPLLGEQPGMRSTIPFPGGAPLPGEQPREAIPEAPLAPTPYTGPTGMDEGKAALQKALGLSPEMMQQKLGAMPPGFAVRPEEAGRFNEAPAAKQKEIFGAIPPPVATPAPGMGGATPLAPGAAPQGIMDVPLAPLFAGQYPTLQAYGGNPPEWSKGADAEEMFRRATALGEKNNLQRDLDLTTPSGALRHMPPALQGFTPGEQEQFDAVRQNFLQSVGLGNAGLAQQVGAMREQGEQQRADTREALAEKLGLAQQGIDHERVGVDRERNQIEREKINPERDLSSAAVATAIKEGKVSSPEDAAMLGKNIKAMQSGFRGKDGTTPSLAVAERVQAGVRPGVKSKEAIPQIIAGFTDQELANPDTFNALIARMRKQFPDFDNWSTRQNVSPDWIYSITPGGMPEEIKQLKRLEAAYSKLGGPGRGDTGQLLDKMGATMGLTGATAIPGSTAGATGKAAATQLLKKGAVRSLYGLPFAAGWWLGDRIWGQ